MTACPVNISVQTHDFDIGREVEDLRVADGGIGAIVTFSGLVRDYHDGHEVSGLFLEHYPGMTENSLRDIATQARARWSLRGITIIHRIGELRAGDQIVFVAVASSHRSDAFAAGEFIMDYLKTRAPFWKKSLQSDGEHWVDARDSDESAAARWRSETG